MPHQKRFYTQDTIRISQLTEIPTISKRAIYLTCIEGKFDRQKSALFVSLL